MATEAYQTQLERVQASIKAIEERGQRYEISSGSGGRRLDRGDLATLYAREKELRRLIANAARGGGRTRQAAPA